jgi:hypothetical protein
MLESVFQTFLLLAYFDIALLSITIANYAVSASYLGRESRLSRWRMERRKKKLRETIKDFKETAQFGKFKNEINKIGAEERRLGIRIFLLSWLGAVILPSMFFAMSLICAVVGINSEILTTSSVIQHFLQQQLIEFSVGALGIGFMVLLFVIRAIDSAARKLPIPEFEVYFENRANKIKITRDQRKSILFCINNKGEDVAQDVQVFVFFPPAFEVHESGNYDITRQGSETDFPDYNAAIFREDLFHIDTILNLFIDITSPDEKKTYEIPLQIYERKIDPSKHKLEIEVTD